RPAADLLARVPLAAPARIADLGCGPGNSTALLVQRWPAAEVLGIDSSAAMLAKAEASGLEAGWRKCDLAAWTPDAPYDLLFSNAALHWLPDHARLLPRLLGHLRPGGVLAVQMPRNFEAPSHALLREVARAGPWAGRLAPCLERAPVAAPEWYRDLLAPLTEALDIWQTEYLHVLEGEDPVLSWTPEHGPAAADGVVAASGAGAVRGRLRRAPAHGLPQATRRPYAVPLPPPVRRRNRLSRLRARGQRDPADACDRARTNDIGRPPEVRRALVSV
ncbi:MAG: trans-aconitate methyltransferase, partial [Geminicoccaceae bacterium]|nr:trans-aconitate methyltransferase [Geminicoccaceae bacterium]